MKKIHPLAVTLPIRKEMNFSSFSLLLLAKSALPKLHAGSLIILLEELLPGFV